MPIQIEVQEVHIEPLISFYLNRLKSLRDEIIDREKEMKDINTMIQKLKRRNISVEQPVENTIAKIEYSDKWPWVKKISFAMEIQNKPLTTKQIVETLMEFEPSFLFDRKRAVASISSILSSKSGTGREFIRIDGEFGEFSYDLNKESSKLTQISESEQDSVDDLPF